MSGDLFVKQRENERAFKNVAPNCNMPHLANLCKAEKFDTIAVQTLGALQKYKKSTGTFTFMVMYFTENYTELLPMLSLLRSLDSSEGFALV